MSNHASLFECCRELLNDSMYEITDMHHEDRGWLANEFMHVNEVESNLFANLHWLAQLKSWDEEIRLYKDHCYDFGVIAYDIDNDPADLFEAIVSFGITNILLTSSVLSRLVDSYGGIRLNREDVTDFLNELNQSDESRIRV